MPYLGDGTWVDSPELARDIVRGRTNYRPHSGDVTNLQYRKTSETNVEEYNSEAQVNAVEDNG